LLISLRRVGAPPQLTRPRTHAAFSNYFIDFAVCCPSRTSFLTGKCLHNSGSVYPTGPIGGFAGFTRFGNDKSTIFKWLRDSGLGYKLGIFGKLMNGLNVGGGLQGSSSPAAYYSNGVPVVNTSVAGTAANPAPLSLVGYSGANNNIFQGGADPDTGVGGSTAQYYLPGFDIPNTAANPYTGYPGYQNVSKDKWYVFQNLPGFSDWQVSNNGNYELHGWQGVPGDPATWNASDYSTDVINGELVKFINEAGADNKPFFAWVSPYPPHAPALPAPRHVGALNGKGVIVPRNPNFAPLPAVQAQKVSAIGQYPQYGTAQTALLDWVYQTRAESLLSYDDLVGTAVAALAATGQLNNTYIVFTSDNGYHLGQFNLAGGKQSPYEEDVHLPLYIRGPGVTPGSTVPHLVANIDLAITFADLAGLNIQNNSLIPSAVDGRSFKPVLLGSGASSVNSDAFRQAFLIEKVITGDDFFHIPTPFVRFTEGNSSADLWANWRSYPAGGFPSGASVFGALSSGTAAAGSNTVTGGVSPYPGLQSYTLPTYGSRYATFANGNSPGWDHVGNPHSPAYAALAPGNAAGSPATWAANGAFLGEPQFTTLAVALSGYANNKGATFEDLFANWQSAAAGGPVDALGNGILGALNVAGQSEGSTWWWGAAYAVNYGVFPNGTALVSSTNIDAFYGPYSYSGGWVGVPGLAAFLNSTTSSPAGPLPLGYLLFPNWNATGVSPTAAVFSVGRTLPAPTLGNTTTDGDIKVDYQTVTGFNFPSPYYGLRVVSSRYNLLYVEFPTGVELYDLSGSVSGTADPWQLSNVYTSAPPALKVALARELEKLKICRGNGNLAGGTTPATSIPCVLANVPEFTASPPAGAAAPAQYVRSALTLGGYAAATFSPDAASAFARALAGALTVPTSAVVITSVTDAVTAAPSSGRHLLQSGGATVAFGVATTAAAATALRTALAAAGTAASPVQTALAAALPQLTSVAVATTPTVATAAAPTSAAPRPAGTALAILAAAAALVV